MRKLVSVVLAAGLLASLSACASGPAPTSDVFASCTSGGNAALVTAKGKIGDDPQASFPTPLVAKRAETSVALRGDGRQVEPGDAVGTLISVYDGETGKPVADSNGAELTGIALQEFVSDGRFPFLAALSCATVGSRVVTTGLGQDLLGEDFGLTDVTIVVVADIGSAFPGKATGADQVPQAGYPSVVTAPDGRPGFTFPSGEIPGGLGSIALKQGDGKTVKEGDTIVANFSGVVWGADSTFISSWDQNAPARLPVTDDSGLAPGVTKALIGQKVGSQLLVVASGDDGFPSGQEPTGVAPGDTVVFVVDILAISQ